MQMQTPVAYQPPPVLSFPLRNQHGREIQEATISAGTAFKIGFFGIMGVFCGYLAFIVVIVLPIAILGGFSSALSNR